MVGTLWSVGTTLGSVGTMLGSVRRRAVDAEVGGVAGVPQLALGVRVSVRGAGWR